MLGGSRNAAKPPCEMGELDDSKLNEDVTADLASWLPRYFPSVIPQADIEFSWSGIMGFTPDYEPVVSELPSKHGQWISAGFSGHGMSRAFAASVLQMAP
jgi:glycine/D-amino acid oxidase-like deaminating enzyme